LNQVRANFFDGETARDHTVSAELVGREIKITGDTISPITWNLSDLHPIDPPAAGMPFRLTHTNHPGARLIVADLALIDSILNIAPHLKHGYYAPGHLKQVALWTIGGLGGLAAAGYVLFAVLPGIVAGMLPDSWRERAGQQIESMVVADAKTCAAPTGVAAFNKMLSRLTAHDPELPKVKLTVYDMDLLNAFAAPGNRIIFTKEILLKADGPDEIAGVLAHELGHVVNLHSEQSLVRYSGFQILASIFSGGGSDVLTTTAGVAAILRYSRAAETEADTFARETLEKSKVNPLAFRDFFKKLLKLEGASTDSAETSTMDRIGNMLSTHPDTKSRMEAIKPLPAGITVIPSLTTEEWKELQGICGTVK
jgi:beta-barrel assembly-enhancing protease